MKKKAIIILTMTAMLLTACSNIKKDENKNEVQQPDVTYETTDTDNLDEGATEGTEDSNSEAATDEKIETGDTENEPQNDTSAVTEAIEEVGEEVSEEVSEASSEASGEGEVLPGPETVVIVNLRGDETTVYKLVDGTYMDRIEKRFTYNGTDTWTDEDGVEWNEKVN